MRVFDRDLPVDGGFYLVAPRKARNEATLAVVQDWLLAQAGR